MGSCDIIGAAERHKDIMKKIQTNASNKKAVKRIEAAANEVSKRCDEICIHAADPKNLLSECFSLARTVCINESCGQFLLAIAESESIADIIAARKALERLKERVLQANRKIAARLGDNQDILEGVACCEETFLRLLLEGDPTIRIVAKFAASHLTVIRIVVMSALTSLRKQLENIERSGEVKVRTFSFKALQQLLAAIRGRPADKAEALDFMRSLYNTGDREFDSCHKVINYVRTCTYAHDPYFNQCVRIRTLVKTFAKKDRAGEERIWRSFAQELKPSHAKCRKAKFSD